MTPAPFRPTLPPLRLRLAIAVVVSLIAHALFVSGVMRGLADVFGWSKRVSAEKLTVRTRLAPPPESPPVAAPAPSPEPTPRKRREASPAPALPVATPVAQAAPAAEAPGPAPTPAISEPVTPAAPEPPPVPAAPPPKAARKVPLPPRALINFELTLESNNYKVWATQQWSMADGRYRIVLTAEARALFFTLGSIVLESLGVVSADGLRPERYVDERNKRRTTVDFSANERLASVEEANGNRKTVALAGQAADIMSLTYDLAFNPDINVGAPFTLSNRDNIEEIRLVAVRDEVLPTEAGALNTRYYDFRRPGGGGGIQVWLAVERQWLPARIRIQGRDGAINMVATGYDLNPPDSR
jgi:hypothetical protein